jgi:hypothetical protein
MSKHISVVGTFRTTQPDQQMSALRDKPEVGICQFDFYV